LLMIDTSSLARGTGTRTGMGYRYRSIVYLRLTYDYRTYSLVRHTYILHHASKSVRYIFHSEVICPWASLSVGETTRFNMNEPLHDGGGECDDE
jgi:hypothetical protein